MGQPAAAIEALLPVLLVRRDAAVERVGRLRAALVREEARLAEIERIGHAAERLLAPPPPPAQPPHRTIGELAAELAAQLPTLFPRHPAGLDAAAIMAALGCDYSRACEVGRKLAAQQKARWVYDASGNIKRLIPRTASPVDDLRAPPDPAQRPPTPLSEQQARVLATLARHAFEGKVSLQRAVLVREANVPSGSVVFLTDCLIRKGYLETVEVGGHGRATIYRVLKAPPGDPLVTAGSPTPQPQPAARSPEINLSTPAPKRAPRPVEPEAPVARIAPPPQVDLSRLAEDAAAPTLGPKTLMTLMTLRARECRWPEGEPGRDGQAYCGERVAGDTPYCSKHLARMHPPPKGKTTGEARP
jgi:hypothetical protein